MAKPPQTRPRDPRFYVPREDEITMMEMEGTLPHTIDTAIMVFGRPQVNWGHFGQVLRDTSMPVEMVLDHTPLASMIEPYKHSLPIELEGPARFFVRNMEAFGANAEVVSLFKRIAEQTGDDPDEVLACINSHDVGLYAGEEILRRQECMPEKSEAKLPEGGTKKRMRYRGTCTLKEYTVDFTAGVNRNGDWFYQMGHRTPEHAPAYRELVAAVRGLPDLSMHKERRDVVEIYGRKTGVLVLE